MAIWGTGGDDTLTGTPGADIFRIEQGGNDTVDAGDGDDLFRMGLALNPGDTLIGGGGFDTVRLDGNYSFTLGQSTFSGVEQIELGAGFDYRLVTRNANLAGGDTLTVNGRALGAGDTLEFNGSAETNGHFNMIGGAGADILTGGAQSDVFSLKKGGADMVSGGGGSDLFVMGSGAETLVYGAANESSSTQYDVVHGFNGDADKFDLTVGVTGFTFLTPDEINAATFDADLAAAFGDGVAGALNAAFVQSFEGDLRRHFFMVVFAGPEGDDGDHDYVPGVDYVFDITRSSGTIDIGDFI